MIRILIALVLIIPSLSNAKDLEYGFIGGKWMCKEYIATGRNSSEYLYKGCNSNNLWDIQNRDDQTWLKDGNFHINSYNEYKPAKNMNNSCGLKYNPKDGKTYKYPPCVKTFKY